MAAGSRFGSASVSLGRGGGTVTLVQQASFCLFSHDGDIHPGGAQGVYAGDTRILSRLELSVADEPLELLSVAQDSASQATFVLRTAPPDGHADSRVMVLRRRGVDGGLDETIELRNHRRTSLHTIVRLDIDVDLADLFVVKQGDSPATQVRAEVDDSTIRYERAGESDGHDYGVDSVEVRTDADRISRYHVRWTVDLPPGGTWTGHVTVRPAD
jgi:hypothetical protein